MSRQDIEQVIADAPFFDGLGTEAVTFLASCARRASFSDQEAVFTHGAPADAFYLLLSGGITVEIGAISGPPLMLEELTAGSVLGWSWLIPPYRWHFQARAVAPTEVLAFDGAAVRRHCEDDPQFGLALFKRFSGLMSERMEHARRTMMESWNPPGFA